MNHLQNINSAPDPTNNNITDMTTAAMPHDGIPVGTLETLHES